MNSHLRAAPSQPNSNMSSPTGHSLEAFHIPFDGSPAVPQPFDWIVIPDLQPPFHDKKAVKSLIEYVRWRRPDGLLCVGDEIDLPQVSRWTKGTAGEFAGGLKRDCETTKAIMVAFREALGPDRPFHMSRSNHGDRLDLYVQRYAPALADFVEPGAALDIPNLCGYGDRDIDITYHRQPFEFHPGWILCHGDEGNLSPLAGRTATNLGVNKFGKSVVAGHTHRLGISHHTTSVAGRVTRTITGVEVGHLMDLKQATYLGGGSGNWQRGFGEVRTYGRHVSALVHPIHPGGVILRSSVSTTTTTSAA